MAAMIDRIRPQEAREHLRTGGAWLVCAYHSDEQFRQNRLDGAISLSELRTREASLDKDQELIFYCA